jgi:hypothetical protein
MSRSIDVITRLQRYEGTGLAASTVIGRLLSALIVAGLLLVANLPSAKADDLDRARAIYRQQLAAYRSARAAYESEAAGYWAAINQKRKRRLYRLRLSEPPVADDYVVEQPPLYSGPPRPKDPDKPDARDGDEIPVIADFLRNADRHFGFTPEKPTDEHAYRRAYARAALAAGLTPRACVKVYAFESGGDGGYAVQAGLEYDRPGARAISTALGYNQLLTTNSVELLAEQGDEIIAELRSRMNDADGERRERLLRKTAIVKKMIAFSRSVPDRWSDHTRLAATPAGIGVHALILDIDVGPLLQVHKLLTSVTFARRKGFNAPLTAAELEMMNLTGDGNGFDMVRMPDHLRRIVPTANFFQAGGYERNPVAIRNNTVAALLAATDAKMEQEAQLPGAKALAAAFAELRN